MPTCDPLSFAVLESVFCRERGDQRAGFVSPSQVYVVRAENETSIEEREWRKKRAKRKFGPNPRRNARQKETFISSPAPLSLLVRLAEMIG